MEQLGSGVELLADFVDGRHVVKRGGVGGS